MRSPGIRQIKALFTPESVAVFGASSRRANATGNEVVRYIRKTEHECTLHIVNPSGGVIEGIEAVKTLDAVPHLDLAVVALPSAAAVEVVEALEASGCPSVIVMSVGLSDADVERLGKVHRRGITHVHGPNCMGLINVTNGFHAWANEDNLAGLAKGNVSIVSQSGSGAIFVARSMSGLGFSKIISTGNEAGATTADYLDILCADPDTSVVGLIIESIPDGKAFARSVRRSQAAGKSLALLKVGRSENGAAATKAHTGALLSSDAAYLALMEKLGVPLVADYDELAATLEVLATRPTIESPGVGVLTISGGQAALCADLAETVGVRLPAFSAQTRALLAELLPDQPLNNPLDVAGGPEHVEDVFQRALEIVARDPEIGVVMPILDLQDSLTPVESAFEDEYFEQAVTTTASAPLVVASSSSVSIHPSRRAAARNVPIIRGIRNALVGIRSATVAPVAGEPTRPSNLAGQELIADLKSRLAREHGSVSPETLGALVSAYRLPFVEGAIFSDLTEATSWAEVTGFPVVLKIASPDIAHRSDIGGVVVGVRDAVVLAEAWRAIMANVATHRPEARVIGIEVQKQLVGQIEAFAGFVSDPHLGATVAVGLGGVLVELIKDVARMSAPADASLAAQKIKSSKLGLLLGGHRNLHPETPVEPLADLVTRLSWMAEDLGEVIKELDFNPVLIEPGSGRVRLVDALAISSAEG